MIRSMSSADNVFYACMYELRERHLLGCLFPLRYTHRISPNVRKRTRNY